MFVEYAKAGPEDVLVRITVHNRGPEAARLRVLPTLWFRNTWSWGDGLAQAIAAASGTVASFRRSHPDLGDYWLHCDGTPELLFTENESNAQRLWGQPNASPYVKDAFHDRRDLAAGRCGESRRKPEPRPRPTTSSTCRRAAARRSACAWRTARSQDAFGDFEQVFASRIADADEFYQRITPSSLTEDQRRVHRQALAGMLWSKQYYYFDLDRWLREHRSHPLQAEALRGARNTEWFHMLNADVISMPDKWEYPWYAAWDLAFHTVALALVDFDFAKEQLLLMLRSLYFHPNGQIPAYEWNFSDVNPPVHAWATLWLYRYEKQLGRADLKFLEHSFQGLMLNFNWWVNRKDPDGAQRLRRRLSRPRQYRRVRPQRAAADRRHAGAGGRHGVDGVLLPEHAGDRPHPGRERSGLRGDRLQVRPSTSCGSPTPWIARASVTTRCGTRRTGSSTTCCGCPTAGRCV